MNKLSIVTTSYNQGNFIEHTIQSILSQTHPLIEYIVVDGGSTDNTFEVLSRYKSQIDFIISEPDEGPADALNKAFKIATGDFFAFLNSDDLCDPTFASELISSIQATNADLVYSDVRFIDQYGSIIKPYSFPIAYAVPLSGRKLFSKTCIVPQQGSIWSRRIYDYGITFNVQNRTCWDLEFFVDAYCAGFIFQPIYKCLSSFRIHPNSISGQSFFSDADKNSARQKARISDHSRIKSKLIHYGYSCSPVRSQLCKIDNLANKTLRFLSSKNHG